jgi:hypothetical protein
MILFHKYLAKVFFYLLCSLLTNFIYMEKGSTLPTYSIQDLGTLGNNWIYRGTSAADGINASVQVTGVWSGGNGFVVTPLDTNSDGIADHPITFSLQQIGAEPNTEIINKIIIHFY